ncbi:immunoglobulin superfamily member 22-like, partial [Saccoglossus kowalevskii]|uniref:Titin-like n=1 Tax=Saccoglossus kowalevskii TaxID=10224 RepID=A0ABM0MQU6_SACKO
MKIPPPIKPKDTIPGAPYFIESPLKVVAKEGDNVKFEAVVEGDPEPKVSWYRGARLLSDGGRFMIFHNEVASVHTMQMKKILPKDTGKYSCKIENEKGSDSSAFSLLVEALAKDEVDWRSMLKHKEYSRRQSKDEDPDWGKLKHRGSRGSIDEEGGQIKLKKVERKQKSYAEVTAPLKKTKVNASLGRARLPCGVRYLNCEPRWFKDGKQLENGDKYKLMKRKEDVELIILDIKPEDSGEYSVEFGDPAIAGSTAELTIEPQAPSAAKKRTRFTKKLKTCQVKEGEEAKFECMVTNANLPFHWEKKGSPVKRDKRHQVIDVGKTRILMIKNVTPADEGEIKCFCGDEPDSAELFVEPKPKPQFVKLLQSQQVMERDRAVLQCDVNMDDVELIWLKDGAPVKADNRVKIRHAGLIHQLIFEDVKMDDEADYEVKVKGLEETCSSCSLLVDEYKPPPDFDEKLTDVVGCEDDEAEFVAKVNDKDVEVQWLKDGKPIPKDPRIKHTKQGVLRKLIIKPVTPEDQGEYTCIAGDKKTVASLKVEGKPEKMTLSPKKQLTKKLPIPEQSEPPKGEYEFQRAQLKKFNTPTKIHNTEIEPPSSVKKTPAAPLSVDNKPTVPPSDIDNKQRAPPSDVKESSTVPRSIKLVTLDEPSQLLSSAPPIILTEDRESKSEEKPKLDIGNLRDFKVKAGETFDITLPFTGVPVPTVAWTLRGKEVQETSNITMKTTETTIILKVEDARRVNGGVYQVTLTNASGSDSATVKVTVLDAPGTPEGPLLASDVTANSLTLQWKPPLDGADETDNYIVEKCEVGTGKWQRITSFCSGPSCKVRNLNEGTEYQFRVMAENQYGASKPLTGESVVAKNPFNCPGSPGQPKATETTKTSISLQWTAPTSDGGNPIIGYLVEKKDLRNDKWVMVTKSPLRSIRYTVPKLVEGHEYEFRVSAVNEAGPGKPSSTSEAIMAAPPAKKPSISPEFKHKTITVRAGDPFRLEVPFDGSPVPQTIWSLEDKGDVEIQLSDRLTSETDEFSVLLKCKCAERDDTGRYKLTLKNPKGSDTASIKVNVVDHPGPPQGPLNVSGVTAESVKLSWSPPKDDGGSPVTNYIIEKRETGTTTWQKVSTFAKSTTYEVPNLEEGVEYSFRVLAENEYGVSDPLDTSRPVTAKNPYDVPDSPGKPDIKGIDRGFVSLTWTEPESDGGSPIIGYFVEKKERDSSTWMPAVEYVVKATSVSLVNLDEYSEYEFRIKAKNAAGYGRPSKNSDSVTPCPQYTNPGAPGTPIIDDVDKHHIDLSWSPPKNDGGSKVTGYNVEYREPENNIWTKANIFTAKEPRFTVGDLIEGQQYIFRVIAVNIAGPGEPSGETDPVEAKDKI